MRAAFPFVLSLLVLGGVACGGDDVASGGGGAAAGGGGGAGGTAVGGSGGGVGGQGATGGDGGAGGQGATGPCGGVIGPQNVPSTSLDQGTHYVSASGTGSACTESDPCAIATAIGQAGPGSVIFLRGGEYPVATSFSFNGDGTASNPIVVESYPGEWAIFDGSQHDFGAEVYIRVTGSFYRLRNFEVRYMPRQGIWIGGNDNELDGIVSHHNKLTGIHIYSPYDEYPYGAFGSRNLLRNCTAHDNSGVGDSSPEYADGGNSDGISISSGADNEVDHCLVVLNSDDGIDTWRSTGTLITCSIARESGLGSGNGNGFKSGGLPPASGTVVRHSISYGNQAVGFDFNSGVGVVFDRVTAFGDARGFYSGDDTQVLSSIAAEDSSQSYGSGIMTGNCWQIGGVPQFVSTDPSSADFMRLTAGSDCEDLGAYSDDPP